MRRTKVEVGIGVSEVTDGIGHYEGEVIQLLSNLRATLLGGELMESREGRGERKLRPAGFPTLYNSQPR